MGIINVDIKDTISVWWQATNELGAAIGDMDTLEGADSDLVSAFNTLKLITEQNDSDLWALVNKHDSDIGDRSTLLTSNKDDLVSAINEIYNYVKTTTSEWGA